MKTIYEPGGRALEYAELALNLYTGCAHGCKYCYVPKSTFKAPALFHAKVTPRKGILRAIEKDAPKFRRDERAVHLCFSCDPYPPAPCEDVTRAALQILSENIVKVQILTKGGARAIRDFDILQDNSEWSFGTTLCFISDDMRRRWEPNAPTVTDRVGTIIEAKKRGIKTWVSIEPVVDAGEALEIIDVLYDHVDFWKVGKLNHMPDIEAKIDWDMFLKCVEGRLEGCEYIIKKDLLEAAGRAKR